VNEDFIPPLGKDGNRHNYAHSFPVPWGGEQGPVGCAGIDLFFDPDSMTYLRHLECNEWVAVIAPVSVVLDEDLGCFGLLDDS